jgi:hypothetical protein
MVKTFFAGAIAGAVVMWLWGERIRDVVDDATVGIRTQASDRLHGVADTLQSVADTVDQGLSGTQPRVS